MGAVFKDNKRKPFYKCYPDDIVTKIPMLIRADKMKTQIISCQSNFLRLDKITLAASITAILTPKLTKLNGHIHAYIIFTA